ncbi:hypothetical protein BSZ39_03380 [Bowdeniella nasicola]|uniref:Uncharacterized protein n=1 Tax=Bowdeniella nasicola TaxID=208480 RepID=A0A1Q5Q4G3_9ACTO|nr:hypothetical protein [Bowdeniella nasicola]OKL54579.1 hypothetical protein BSZ39_03380 [Bowdeniella nasicola]
MTTSILTTRTVVAIIPDDDLRATVHDLAELAGAVVPERPWEIALGDPHCIVVLGLPLDAATVASLDAAARERAIVVTREGPDDECDLPETLGTHLSLPRQSDELLARLSHLSAAAPIIRVAGLHGGAGATRFAASLARLAEQDSFRVVLLDADPRGGAALLLEIESGEAYARLPEAISWADIGDGLDLLPLRIVAGLPKVNGVSILTGGAPDAATCWRVANVLRHACDLVIVDGCLPTGALADTRADLDVVIGTPSPATIRAFHLLEPDDARVLALRTPGTHPLEITLAECGAMRTVTFRSERSADRDAEHGIAPGDRVRSATMVCARKLWREAKAA